MALSKTVSLAVNSRGCIPRIMERDGPSVQLGNGIEVACGDYIEEDDIVRFDDKYGRIAG